ncbi:hypothetical protein [Methanococcoides sp. FTZ1]|uniref:hypothetical protein n=1 Tax=Methanococcoides sp. FTZ1 TaxID=3439061 RepID=UPI003F85BEF2
MEISKDNIVTEEWNAETNTWEHNPRVIAATGIGGASPYHEVNESDIGSIKESIKKYRKSAGVM